MEDHHSHPDKHELPTYLQEICKPNKGAMQLTVQITLLMSVRQHQMVGRGSSAGRWSELQTWRR